MVNFGQLLVCGLGVIFTVRCTENVVPRIEPLPIIESNLKADWMKHFRVNTAGIEIPELGQLPEDPGRPVVNDHTIAYPKEIHQANLVKQLLKEVNMDEVKSMVTKFTSFHNRYYKSQFGVESADWLATIVEKEMKGYSGKVDMFRVKHDFPQKSIVARITGSDERHREEIIVIGAHLDTIVNGEAEVARAPGADDDASGCMGNYELFRIFMQQNVIPKRTIEFHWYAGEEAMDLGSRDIAKAYRMHNKNVIAMTQMDMLGHLSDEKYIGLAEDFTNKKLTKFTKLIVDSYSVYRAAISHFDAPYSDHGAWSAYGYPSSFPTEDKLSKVYHTSNDTVDLVNFNHVKEFIKVGMGFLIELGTYLPPTEKCAKKL